MDTDEKLTEDLQQALGSAAIFDGATQGEIAAIFSKAKRLSFEPGTVIFKEGSEGKELFIVAKGRVAIELDMEGNARPETVYLAKQDDLFGELALLDGHRRSASARAIGDVVVRAFDRDAFHLALEESPRLGFLVMRNLATLLAGRLRDANRNFRTVAAQQQRILDLVNLTVA